MGSVVVLFLPLILLAIPIWVPIMMQGGWEASGLPLDAYLQGLWDSFPAFISDLLKVYLNPLFYLNIFFNPFF